MRRILVQLALFLPLLLLPPFNHASWAQNASVTGATMTWYGVYTVASSTSVSSTKTVSKGVTPPSVDNDHVTLSTKDTIRVGYGYRLIGNPPTAEVALTYRTIFPDGKYQDNVYDGLEIDRQDLFIGQLLDPDSATGTYTLQLWHNSGLLLEKSFVVAKP
jgi:hypothetical protein